MRESREYNPKSDLEIKRSEEEKRFLQALEPRLSLWNSLIDMTRLDEPTKNIFKAIFERQKGNAPSYFRYNPDPEGDFTYATVNLLINAKGDAIRTGVDKDEVNALVANLKNDIWAFYEEVIKE